MGLFGWLFRSGGFFGHKMRIDLAGQYGILALLTHNNVEIGQMNHEFVNFYGF